MDVEKAQLVRAGGIVGARGLHRVAGVDQIDEVDALDHAAIGHVETGYDAGLEHGGCGTAE